jgi:CheY-like chemotaxis protein
MKVRVSGWPFAGGSWNNTAEKSGSNPNPEPAPRSTSGFPRASSSSAEMPNQTRLEILLIDDNPGDVRMVVEGLKETIPSARLTVARDGEEAIRFLRREGSYVAAPRPDLILLDLRLPKKSGFEVLGEIKRDPYLGKIPVMVRSSSENPADIDKAYGLHANCYLIKTACLDELSRTMRALADFWISAVRLPEGEHHG